MPSLTIAPSPALKGSVVRIDGSGFANAKTRLALDGEGVSTNIFRPAPDGTFHVGITVGTTVKVQTLTAQQADSKGKWTQVASQTIGVVNNAPPPPPPVITPVLKVVPVSSIPDLNKYKVDDTVDVIDVANGTLYQDVAQEETPNSLWMADQMRARTRPLLIQAHSDFGVTLDGKGSGNLGIWWGMGAHDVTWRGFQFANTMGAVIELGGFIPEYSPPVGDPLHPPAHDITLLHNKILASCHRDAPVSNQRHGTYFGNAYQRGPYNILIDDLEIQGTDDLCLWGGIHMDHGESANPPADHVTIRNLKTTGLCYPIVLWSRTIHDWLFENCDITNPRVFPGISGGNAIRNESNATNLVFRNVVSRGSQGGQGYYDSRGYTPLNPPPGVTFDHCDLR